jgi:pyridoxal phosphate enzyme (YggS family)
MHPHIRSLLAERLHAVRERIDAACRRAVRAPDSVTLVAVTKSVSSDVAQMLRDLGVPDLGESRPQELWKKAAAIQRPVRWHLVGHLQRNKIDRTISLVTLIHSVDSLRLLEALEQEAAKQHLHLRVLLEVNASREEAKHGFNPAEMPKLAKEFARFSHLEIAGLMTMAAMSEDPEEARPAFAEMRRLRDQVRDVIGDHGILPELSMGMTHDYEVAIEEGATLVRIGSALFDGLPEPAA